MADFSIVGTPQVATRRSLFLIALLALTAATTVLYPLFGTYIASSEGRSNFIFISLGWLSTAHVATTAFFYADREFLPHALSRPIRYIYAPAAAIVACVAAWGLTYKTINFWYPWQIYHAWLLWHYMRQNIGVASLSAQTSSETRLSDLERRAIAATSIGAILGASRFGPDGPLSEAWEGVLTNLGCAIYIGSLLALSYSIYLRRREDSNAYVVPSFLFVIALFFAPTFLYSDYISAVMGYAVAHALQYWFLISLIAIGSGRKAGYLRSAGSLLGLTVSVWFIIYLSRQPELWDGFVGWAAGLGFGITIAHFVVDADAWRLREKFQRNYVMSRLKPFMTK